MTFEDWWERNKDGESGVMGWTRAAWHAGFLAGQHEEKSRALVSIQRTIDEALAALQNMNAEQHRIVDCTRILRNLKLDTAGSARILIDDPNAPASPEQVTATAKPYEAPIKVQFKGTNF